jgi:light-regulated signal transduction histidine kinase (bacteriophytochrome)
MQQRHRQHKLGSFDEVQNVECNLTLASDRNYNFKFKIGHNLGNPIRDYDAVNLKTMKELLSKELSDYKDLMQIDTDFMTSDIEGVKKQSTQHLVNIEKNSTAVADVIKNIEELKKTNTEIANTLNESSEKIETSTNNSIKNILEKGAELKINIKLLSPCLKTQVWKINKN